MRAMSMHKRLSKKLENSPAVLVVDKNNPEKSVSLTPD
jgi:hypothetical protein